MINRLLPILILVLILTTVGCNRNKTPESYLRKVLANMEKIETAVYKETAQPWNPGDTVPAFTRCSFVKEYTNPKDTTIGASFVELDCKDTTKLEFGYDGEVRIIPYHGRKGVVIDDFTARPLPYRPVPAPFFNYTKSIIHYILESTDSLTIETQDLDKEYYLKLTIFEDRQIEFFGRDYRMPDNSMYFGETTSIYELWFNKDTDLPYKVRREMSHSISVRICSDVEINTLSIDDFNIYDYYPKGYEVRKYEIKKHQNPSYKLIGKKAPDWTLNDMNGQSVALSGLKSKVVLVNFTGIGCGPCVMAIPFLNTLKENYHADDLEVVSIETWSGKSHSLQNYAKKHKINYTFLSGDDPVTEHYQTGRAAPFFFVLDKDRIIRHVFFGYKENETDEEIQNAIKELSTL